MPSQRKIDYYRRKLFSIGPHTEVEKDNFEPNKPDSLPIILRSDDSQDPIDRTQNAYIDEAVTEITPTKEQISMELKSVVNQLANEELDDDEEKRVYLITESPDGPIQVTALPPDFEKYVTAERIPVDTSFIGRSNDGASMGLTNHVTISRLGSDPQPSERDLEKNSENREWDHEIQDESPGDLIPVDYRLREDLLSESLTQNGPMRPQSKTINLVRATHQERSSPPSLFSHCSPNTPTSLSICNPIMTPRPAPTERPRVTRSMACAMRQARLSRPPVPGSVPAADAVVDVPVWPEPDQYRPGLLAAAHVIQLEGTGYQDPSYFAYGATVVVEDNDGVILTHQGHCLIHLYSQHSPAITNTPPPPPPGRTEAARLQLFRIAEPEPEQTSDVEGLGPSLRRFRFNPEAPEFELQSVSNEKAKAEATNQSPEEAYFSVESSDNENTSPGRVPCRVPNTTPDKPVSGTSPSVTEELWFAAKESLETRANPEIKESAPDRDVSGPIRKDFLSVPAVREASPAPTYRQSIIKERVIERKEELETCPISRKRSIDDMEIDSDDDLPPFESPPALSYPPEDQSAAPADPKLTSTVDKAGVSSINPGAPPLSDKPPSTKPTDALIEYPWWHETTASLKKRSIEGESWSSVGTQQDVTKLGLLRWWFNLNIERDRGREPDLEAWKTKNRKELTQRWPDLSDASLDTMVEQLDEIARIPRPKSTLALKIVKTEDVDMKVEDVPEPLSPPTSPLSSPSPPPLEPQKTDDRDVPTLQLDPEEFEQLRRQVDDLEMRVKDSTEMIEQRLTRLGVQVYEDGITVTNLQWMMNSGRKTPEEVPSPGKRSYKKAKERSGSHRYPTRGSLAQDEEPLKISKKEFHVIEGRIKGLETGVARMKGEQKRLREELSKTKDLKPEIDALSQTLRDFKVAQIKVNDATVQQFVHVQQLCNGTLLPHAQTHARLILELQHRYNGLAAIANSLVAQQRTRQMPTRHQTSLTLPPPVKTSPPPPPRLTRDPVTGYFRHPPTPITRPAVSAL